MLRDLELLLREQRRLVRVVWLRLVLLREERIPRIARESMVEVAVVVVADEGRNIKVVIHSPFWRLVVR
jgi:hypothetical protein